MFVRVKLLNGFPEPLLYKIPAEWEQKPVYGSLLAVPLKDKILPAFVIDITDQKPFTTFDIRDAQELKPFPQDAHYFEFIKTISTYHKIDTIYTIKRLKAFLKQKSEPLVKDPHFVLNSQETIVLTDEQKIVVDFLKPHIINSSYQPTVLHGVTGSGKTEVYKELILTALQQKKSVLLLLPEVTLAVQFEKLLKRQLPLNLPIFGFHCATAAQDRKKLWINLLEQRPQLIIGVHLPILLPLPRLGLIIVDEEHESGFQEKKHPKFNTKDIALMRAAQHKIPIVLGSATPSLQTLYNVHTRHWNFFQLKKRFAGAFPLLEFVSLGDKKERKNFWISTQLQKALKEQLSNGKQSIIFLNRRGMGFFVQCKECSFVFMCRSCSVSLTPHKDNSLRCHYCSYQEQKPESCKKCGALKLISKGIGTQQVVNILEKMFPLARIARADMDTSVDRKLWTNIMNSFEKGDVDILVGTQTITKGYHFPNVTLVGVLWADVNLNFPLYNAQETTLQQLIQVAGRAGRQHKESKVIVQSVAEHDLFKYVDETLYDAFYASEIEKRKDLGYPPVKRLLEIEMKHKNEQVLEKDSSRLAFELMSCNDIRVLGPAQPPVAKIKELYSRKIYIKSDSFSAIDTALKKINSKYYKAKIYYTPNPQT